MASNNNPKCETTLQLCKCGNFKAQMQLTAIPWEQIWNILRSSPASFLQFPSRWKEDIEMHENCICIHTCIYVINHNGYFKRKKLFCVTSSVEIFQSSNMKIFAKFIHRMMLWLLWLDDERHGLYLNSQDAAWKV